MPELITCIMITRPSIARVPRLRQTLIDFAAQTHQPREMVIVIDAASAAEAAPVLQAVAESGQDTIRTVMAGRAMTMGALRNLSWSHARGGLVCVWDDDDRHHPTRLALQSAALVASGQPACFLQEFLHYFEQERRIYRVNFRPAPDPVAVNTVMSRRDLALRYPETGPDANLGEDTGLFRAIRNAAGFHVLADQPHLFVYVNHGANACSNAHHRNLVDQMGASPGLLRRYEAALRRGLAAFDFGPGAITVTGRNGDAFVIEADHNHSTQTVSL